MPKRIQRKRVKGWRMPENTVSVCRPGKWGNPFKVGEEGVPTAKEAVNQFYRYMVFTRPKHLNVSELRGKNLACFCPLDQPCHADVLLKLANQEAT